MIVIISSPTKVAIKPIKKVGPKVNIQVVKKSPHKIPKNLK